MHQHGQDDAESLLRQHGLPVTRENYLHLAHMGNIPSDSPELEMTLPEHLQDWKKSKSRNTRTSGGSVAPSAMPGTRQGYHTASLELIDQLMDKYDNVT